LVPNPEASEGDGRIMIRAAAARAKYLRAPAAPEVEQDAPRSKHHLLSAMLAAVLAASIGAGLTYWFQMPKEVKATPIPAVSTPSAVPTSTNVQDTISTIAAGVSVDTQAPMPPPPLPTPAAPTNTEKHAAPHVAPTVTRPDAQKKVTQVTTPPPTITSAPAKVALVSPPEVTPVNVAPPPPRLNTAPVASVAPMAVPPKPLAMVAAVPDGNASSSAAIRESSPILAKKVSAGAAIPYITMKRSAAGVEALDVSRVVIASKETGAPITYTAGSTIPGMGVLRMIDPATSTIITDTKAIRLID
jgi:hypothetical protein